MQPVQVLRASVWPATAIECYVDNTGHTRRLSVWLDERHVGWFDQFGTFISIPDQRLYATQLTALAMVCEMYDNLKSSDWRRGVQDAFWMLTR